MTGASGIERLYHAKKSIRDMRREAKVLLRRFSGPRLLPGALIIGAQKAGTSSLFDYLRQHPLIEGPLEKEVHFFDLHHSAGLNWYKSHFSISGQDAGDNPPLAIEASPYYMFHPLVPLRVRRDLPDARFIVMLRNPVERAYSHYWHEVKRGYEKLNLEDALEREAERLKGEEEKLIGNPRYQSFNHQHYSYVARGIYATQLERWFQHFSRERFLILESERFFRDPANETARVLEFLGLPPGDDIQFRRVNVGRYSRMDGTIREQLETFYTPHNERLSELLGMAFEW